MHSWLSFTGLRRYVSFIQRKYWCSRWNRSAIMSTNWCISGLATTISYFSLLSMLQHWVPIHLKTRHVGDLHSIFFSPCSSPACIRRINLSLSKLPVWRHANWDHVTLSPYKLHRPVENLSEAKVVKNFWDISKGRTLCTETWAGGIIPPKCNIRKPSILRLVFRCWIQSSLPVGQCSVCAIRTHPAMLRAAPLPRCYSLSQAARQGLAVLLAMVQEVLKW